MRTGEQGRIFSPFNQQRIGTFLQERKKSSLILQCCIYLQYKKCRPRKLCCKLAKWRVLSLSTLANSQHRLSFKFSELFHQGASKNWGISRLGREGGERKEEEEDEKKKPNFLPRGQLEHKQFDFDIYLSAASQSVSQSALYDPCRKHISHFPQEK